MVQRTAAHNQLEATLDAFWPGAKEVFSDITCKIALAFLQRYPTPTSAAKLGEKQMAAFSNAKFVFNRLIDAGDTVVVEHTFHATHTGALPGPTGPIAGTGKDIRLDSCDVIELEGGRVKSFHAYLDMLSLLGQLGLMGAPVAA